MSVSLPPFAASSVTKWMRRWRSDGRPRGARRCGRRSGPGTAGSAAPGCRSAVRMRRRRRTNRRHSGRSARRRAPAAAWGREGTRARTCGTGRTSWPRTRRGRGGDCRRRPRHDSGRDHERSRPARSGGRANDDSDDSGKSSAVRRHTPIVMESAPDGEDLGARAGRQKRGRRVFDDQRRAGDA